MANKRLLTNREQHIDGRWYAPSDHLYNDYKSVVCCELINTSSSAGDWSGVFFQRFGNILYAIEFTQENNYPSDGFTLSTGERPVARIEIKEETQDYAKYLADIITQICESYN